MKTQIDLLHMVTEARRQVLKAEDQGRLSGEDTSAAREFAAGVEAGALWALNYIGAIPFHTVEHVKPSGNGPDDETDAMLASLPGLGPQPC